MNGQDRQLMTVEELKDALHRLVEQVQDRQTLTRVWLILERQWAKE